MSRRILRFFALALLWVPQEWAFQAMTDDRLPVWFRVLAGLVCAALFALIVGLAAKWFRGGR